MGYAAGRRHGLKRRYIQELKELRATYQNARRLVIPKLDQLVLALRDVPTVFVGSGGSQALAQLAAGLHERATGRFGRWATPLELAGLSAAAPGAMVLFSTSGKNSDAAFAMDFARSSGYWPLAVITQRTRSSLRAALAAPDVDVITIASPHDGFLATNSTLAFATQLIFAYEQAAPPEHLPSLERDEWPSIRARCIILTGPGYRAVGTDLETRLSETGLSAAQAVDYRSLAHGRHVGLSRHIQDTSIVAFVGHRQQALAKSILRTLPSEIDVIKIESPLSYPFDVPDLLVASMNLVQETGHSAGLDPGQPGVSDFGRKMYSARTPSVRPALPLGPLSRKSAAAGVSDTNSLGLLGTLLESWKLHIAQVPISGVVLDYDGTCCTTEGRFELPAPLVQDALIRLLAAGTSIGFATGRGKSLYEDLRKWVPTKYWGSILVGLYNGTERLLLSEAIQDYTDCPQPLTEAADRIESLRLGFEWTVVRRRSQITVEATEGLRGARLLALVTSVLQWAPALPCKAVASGHSIDILMSDVSKTQVVEEIKATTSGEVLVIGDQGHLGGNDFEMLASTELSLSVDTCSPDPTRCWNLDRRGERGPDLLVRYLASLRGTARSLIFDWTED